MTSLPEDAAKCIKKIIQEAKKRRNESFRHAGKKTRVDKRKYG